MGRTKVKLAFIVNNSARRTTYIKRKKGLLKMAEELSILCGVEACAILYSAYDPQPAVWPSPFGVQSVVSKFSMMPEHEKSRKMMNLETFLKQRILKAQDHLKKQRKENKENEMTMFMLQCLSAGKLVDENMSMDDLNDLSLLIDKNLKDIGRRIETLNMNDDVMAPSPFHFAAPAPTLMPAPAPAPAPTLVSAHAPTNSNSEEMDLVGQAYELGMDGAEIPFGEVNLPLGY